MNARVSGTRFISSFADLGAVEKYMTKNITIFRMLVKPCLKEIILKLCSADLYLAFQTPACCPQLFNNGKYLPNIN